METSERIAIFKNSKVMDIIDEDRLEWLIDNGFFTAPASTKYHGNYEGGLFDHSFAVMNALVELTERNNLIWECENSPYIVGMFHDLCKIDQYKHSEIGVCMDGKPIYNPMAWDYNNETYLKGHGDKSVMMLASLMRLTEEEVFCICYHMGAFTEREKWNDYTRAIHKYPNVLWTHHADMMATHIQNI